MGIVKLEVSIPELRQALETFKSARMKALEALTGEIRGAVGNALNQMLNAEMTVFLGHADQAGNKRNGYSERDYTLKGIGTVRIKVPVDRKRRFESAIIPKHERVDPRLREDLAALHLAGLSTRTLQMMSKRILGLELSHQSISESLPLLREQAQQWLRRPVSGEWWALIVDGTNFKVRRRGSVEKEPTLVVLGIDRNNHRSILAIEPGHRDDAKSWRTVFRELKQRGLDGKAVRVGVMDGLPGLERVFREEFPHAVTARCWFHSLQNAIAKTPKRLQEAFKTMVKKVMYAEHLDGAKSAFLVLKEAMGDDCSRAIQCLEKDLESLISHYQFDPKVWRALKTTNAVERIHKEFKRRSKAMETMGEDTLSTLLAFTALRLEMGWRKRSIDTFGVKPEVWGAHHLPGFQGIQEERSIH